MPESTRSRWRSEFACGCDSYTTLFRPVAGQPAICHACGETRVLAVIREQFGRTEADRG